MPIPQRSLKYWAWQRFEGGWSILGISLKDKGVLDMMVHKNIFDSWDVRSLQVDAVPTPPSDHSTIPHQNPCPEFNLM